MSILSPESVQGTPIGPIVPPIDTTRKVTTLYYQWNNNIPNTKDLNDTYNGLLRAFGSLDANGNQLPGVSKCIIYVLQNGNGFSISWVEWKDATFLERANQAFQAVKLIVVDTVQTVTKTGTDISETFNPKGLWDDLINILKTYGTYFLIFVILLIVLYIWLKTRK